MNLRHPLNLALIAVTCIAGASIAADYAAPRNTPQAASAAKQALPFIGTRYFNFLGGSGTGYSISIAANGTTKIQLHGTQSSSVEYEGNYTNPIVLKDGGRLLIKGNKIYGVTQKGEVQGESELLTPTAPPK